MAQNLCERPWTLAEGFVVGAGIIVAGLLLEWFVGPVAWDAFAQPVNYIAIGVLTALIIAAHFAAPHAYPIRFLTTYKAAVPALVYASLLTMAMGLTRQTADGRWLHDMLTFWPFVLTYVYLAFILGLATLKRLRQMAGARRIKVADVAFLLNHAGLFIALVTATLGHPDMQRLRLIAVENEPEWRAFDAQQRVVMLPMSIELKRFVMETYDNGAPRRFASDIQVQTRSGENILTTVEVNKPVTVDGWKIYQYDYDTAAGADSRVSILELVRDPWLPAVYIGIFMMLAGALLLVIYTRWSMKRLLPIGALLAVALAIVSYLMPVVRSTTLVPALQSPWFYPHILVYIVCYSLMGVATVIAVYELIKEKHQAGQNAASLIYVGLIFMTFGMMFGAFWAKEAWGHYWSWDPKETWAAVTWFAYLSYLHYTRLPNPNRRVALWMLILAFCLLQMCWWGIKFLPSAQATSIHIYGS